MKIIRKYSENEMIALFLGEEIKSQRFKDQIEDICMKNNIDISEIILPNILDERQNITRKKVINIFRGYPDRDMFERFPKVKEWNYCECESGDLGEIHYINYCYWNELSKDTGKPPVAADTIREGTNVYDVPNDRFIEGADFLDNNTFPPVILVTCDYKKYLCIEGHSRITSYALNPSKFEGSCAVVGKCNREELNYYDGRDIF